MRKHMTNTVKKPGICDWPAFFSPENFANRLRMFASETDPSAFIKWWQSYLHIEKSRRSKTASPR